MCQELSIKVNRSDSTTLGKLGLKEIIKTKCNHGPCHICVRL